MNIKFTKLRIVLSAPIFGLFFGVLMYALMEFVLEEVFIKMNLDMWTSVFISILPLIVISCLPYYLDKENDKKTKIINCILFGIIFIPVSIVSIGLGMIFFMWLLNSSIVPGRF